MDIVLKKELAPWLEPLERVVKIAAYVMIATRILMELLDKPDEVPFQLSGSSETAS